jgi:flagellar biosynthesis protein FlhF
MNLKEDNSSAVEKADSGKKFRLVVRSAEEAVRVIRDKLGENAKVLSVRQVGGTGLKRFVSSP